MSTYDVIVLGTGGVGSAAAFHLAKRGAKVLGLDRFPPGHAHGSSHGHTRIIRKAYFEHPDYVPLLHRAYELWSDLEVGSGKQLYAPVGLIEIGPSHGVVIPGILLSARQHGLPIEKITAGDLPKRFPGFTMAPDHEAVFERDAGYLFVEDCVVTHAAEARKLGARLQDGQAATSWSSTGSSVTVTTSAATYQASCLVITAGAWAGGLLADLGIALRVLRKHLHWYSCSEKTYRSDAGCPAFFYETGAGYYYGFPVLDDRGVKVAEHHGGTAIIDPLSDDRSVESDERGRVQAFLETNLPGVSPHATDHAVCYYTVSPDEHFIVDRHPEYANIVFAAGLSGHGFKFTSVLGEILADLALDQPPSQPIDFLSCRRFTR